MVVLFMVLKYYNINHSMLVPLDLCEMIPKDYSDFY